MLIGRETETRVIGETIEGARRGRTGVLMLSGEPGMGKTTLLRWSEQAATGFNHLSVRGAPADTTLGFAGLLQVVRPLSGHLESLPAGHAALLRGVCALSPPPEVVDRLGVQVALLLLLAAAAEQAPVLVTVDDVQWLDVESRDALLFAARRLDSDAVGMLFAVRTGQPGHDSVVVAARLPILRLSSLGIAATTEMMERIRGVRPPSAVASVLVDATDGNPLALTELVRRLTAGQCRGAEPLPMTLPLTATASYAYADLLDRLQAPMPEALGLLALGDGDDAAAMFAAAEDLGIPRTAAVGLEALGLMRIDTGRVRLCHALLVTAAVERLPPARRRQMHRAIAAALAGGAAADMIRRAWHLAEATQMPDEDVAAALAAVAADQQSTSSHAAALAYDRAATLTPDRLTRALRYQAAADAAAMAGYDEWSLRLLSQAREQVGDPVFRAKIDHARGVRHIVAGRPRDAWALMSASAAVLRPHDRGQAALVLADAAMAALLAGRLEDARTTATRAQQESAEAEVRLAAGVVEGLASLHLGDLSHALELLSAPGEDPGLLEALEPVVEYLVPLTIGLTWSGRYETAISVVEPIVAALRSGGALGILPAALYASGYVNVWQGRLRRAYLHASEARALADEGGNRLWQFLATGCLAVAEAMRGNLSECRRMATSAQQRWVDVDLWHPRDADDALGLAALCVGDIPTAVRHLERANIPQPLSPPVFGRPTVVDLVEAYVRADRTIPDPISRQIDAPAAEGFPAVAAAIWRCRGLVGAVDPGEAFEAALARYADARLPWQEARTLLTYGERLRREGRRVDARQQLRRAFSLFDEVGSPAWADRAATELAASGGEAQRSPAGPSEVLTPQELHVALAAATGATNREVSAMLFLSPKTIEMHLTRIYRKLGLRSRTDLAARFARGDMPDSVHVPPAARPRAS